MESLMLTLTDESGGVIRIWELSNSFDHEVFLGLISDGDLDLEVSSLIFKAVDNDLKSKKNL